MDALLKRREELIKAKQEIERKLKLAATKNRCKDSTKITVTTISEEFAEVNQEESRNCFVLDMKWDSGMGRLTVLKADCLIIKSLVDSKMNFLALPEIADKKTELILENGGIGVCFEHSNFLFYNSEWQQINEKLIGIDRNVVLFNDIEKKIKVVTWPGKKVLHEIDDVENIFKTTEEIKEPNCASDKDNILILKSDGSLTCCNLRTFDETVYIPISSSTKSSFNPKQIVYYNHDTDATLFLVLYDQVIGKLKISVCGVYQDGTVVVASIPIPKNNIFLKVMNPFIIYQDSKHTVHILSLFTLAEETELDLEDKIMSFCMLNAKNFIFSLINGDFIYFNL